MAIESYHQYPEHTIAIYVGNEDLVPFGTYTVDDLIGHMEGKKRWGLWNGQVSRWIRAGYIARVDIDGCIHTTKQTSARPA